MFEVRLDRVEVLMARVAERLADLRRVGERSKDPLEKNQTPYEAD